MTSLSVVLCNLHQLMTLIDPGIFLSIILLLFVECLLMPFNAKQCVIKVNHKTSPRNLNSCSKDEGIDFADALILNLTRDGMILS